MRTEIRGGGGQNRKLIHQEILLVTRRYLTVRYLMVTKRSFLVKGILRPPPNTRGSLGLTVRILMVTKIYLTVNEFYYPPTPPQEDLLVSP